MRLPSRGLATLLTFLLLGPLAATLPCAYAEGGGGIVIDAQGGPDAPEAPLERHVVLARLPPWAQEFLDIGSDAIRRLLKGLVPNPDGVEYPNAEESPIDQFTHQIGSSRFQVLVSGTGNLKLLGGPYYYNSLQGGIGIEYDFFDPADTRRFLALRVSPVYGELAWVRLDAGAAALTQEVGLSLPFRALIEAAFGFEGALMEGPVQPGFRAYARPGIEVNGANDTGVDLYAAVFCRFRIDQILPHLTSGLSVSLTPTISFYDRGDALDDIYPWQGGDRTVGGLRRVWEAVVNLEIQGL